MFVYFLDFNYRQTSSSLPPSSAKKVPQHKSCTFSRFFHGRGRGGWCARPRKESILSMMTSLAPTLPTMLWSVLSIGTHNCCWQQKQAHHPSPKLPITAPILMLSTGRAGDEKYESAQPPPSSVPPWTSCPSSRFSHFPISPSPSHPLAPHSPNFAARPPYLVLVLAKFLSASHQILNVKHVLGNFYRLMCMSSGD